MNFYKLYFCEVIKLYKLFLLLERLNLIPTAWFSDLPLLYFSIVFYWLHLQPSKQAVLWVHEDYCFDSLVWICNLRSVPPMLCIESNLLSFFIRGACNLLCKCYLFAFFMLKIFCSWIITSIFWLNLILCYLAIVNLF